MGENGRTAPTLGSLRTRRHRASHQGDRGSPGPISPSAPSSECTYTFIRPGMKCGEVALWLDRTAGR